MIRFTLLTIALFFIETHLIAQNLGVKVGDPLVALDVFGALAFREGAPRTLVDGTNNNVALDSMGFYRITGPTSAFEVTGFTNGSDGRMLIIVNVTGQTMTLKNLTTSTSANQINTGSGADVLLPANGIATLMYNSSLQKWLLTAAEGSAPQKMGIGMAAPIYPLDVLASTDPMRVQGLQSGAVADSIMTVSAAGVVKRRSAFNVFDDYCRIIFKTATETVSASTTLQDDDELLFSVNANEKWLFEALLDVDGASGHIKYAIDIPSGSLLVDVLQTEGTGIGNMPHFLIRADNTATGQCDIDGSSNTSSAHMKGIINIGVTAGTVKLRWAQASASGSTTVKINSFIKITRVQ